MKKKNKKESEGESISRSVMSGSLRLHELQSARLLWPWNTPGKNTGMGYHSLLQGIFPTQGSKNPGLQSTISHTAGRFFTI